MDLCVAVACLLLLCITPVQAFYLPGMNLHPYRKGAKLEVKVIPITSVVTELPYSYYSLPFCVPKEGIQKVGENVGELRMGDRNDNSPYKFQMMTDQDDVKVCVANPLAEDDVKHFRERIDDYYQVNLMLDNVPVSRFTRQKNSDELLQWTGSPIGFQLESDKQHYVYNHLKFKVLVHPYPYVKDASSARAVLRTGEGLDAMPAAPQQNLTGSFRGSFMVVGFEVMPCSVGRDAEAAELLPENAGLPVSDCDPDGPHQPIREGEKIVYSYSVHFEDIAFRRWWLAHMGRADGAEEKMEGARVRWFSILSSLTRVIAFLGGIVFLIFLRTLRRGFTKYEELDEEAQAKMDEELSGWKLVGRDVFRAPENLQLICVGVGDGVRILGITAVATLFATLGFLSPASRGLLLAGMVLLCSFLGIIAAYVSSRLWCTLKGTQSGCRPTAWKTACFFLGIAFTTLTIVTFLLWSCERTYSFTCYFILLLSWFTISMPLTLLARGS